MAIKATFVSDFTSFQKGVKDAETTLGKFEGNTEKVQKSLQRMVTAFDGSKIISEATLAAAAIDKIGDTSKLTADEQIKLNKIVTEAIAKYQALGQTAPASLIKIQQETQEAANAAKKADQSMGDWRGSIAKVATSLGVTFGVGAISAFVGKVIDTAGHIQDLSVKLGVSTDAVQRWEYAAKQSGASLDTVDTALAKMNQNLGGAGTGIVHALDLAGLQFETIRRLSPEDAFNTIADAIGKMENPALRAEAAVKIFGRTGQELLPAMEAGFTKVGDSASTMSKETIQRLDAAGDAWETFFNKITILSGEAIAAVMDGWTNLQNFLANVTLGTPGKGFEAPGGPKPEPPKVDPAAARAAANAAIKNAEALKTQEEATKKAAEANKAYADSIKTIRDQLSGAALVGEVKKLQAAFDGLTPAQKQSAAVMENVGEAALKLWKEGATLTPQLFRILLATERITPEAKALGNELQNVGDSFKMAYNAAVPFPGLLEGIGTSIGHVFAVKMPPLVEEAIARSKRLKESWSDLSKALSELATIAGGTFGKMVSALGSMIAAANTAKLSLAAIKDGMNAKSMLESLTSVTSGVLGLVTVAIQAGQVLAKIFDRNKGRDMVEAFAETMGGFEALHAQLLTLGDVVGEELWKKLTQGVGRNSPEQAAKVIAEIEAALAAVQQQTEANTVTTEEQAQAQIETATEAAKALEELGAKLSINADEWGAWSDRVTRYLDDLAKNIRAMPVPAAGGGGGTAEPGFASGTHGQFVDFGAGTSVRLHGRERISTPGEEAPHITRIYIDGRKVAEASARYIPEVMEGRF